MNEFELIGRILEIAGRVEAAYVEVGPGDDGAVLRCPKERLVATTDSLVEGVHFRFDLCEPEDVGFKAVSVNLSDLAAMGALPLGVLSSMHIPGRLSDAFIERVAFGIGEACRAFSAPLVGGNIAATRGPFVIAVTALGFLPGRVLRRNGARPHDLVAVSGHLGAAALGLALVKKGFEKVAEFQWLIKRWRRPEPRLALGAKIAEMKAIHGAIDISDGLLQDLLHVLRASEIGADIEVGAIPIPEAAWKAGKVLKVDPLRLALTGGEDYELLVFASKEAKKDLEALGFTVIGEATDRSSEVRLFKGGRPVALPRRLGYQHRLAS